MVSLLLPEFIVGVICSYFICLLLMLSFSIVVFILLFRSVVDNICLLIVVTFMTLFLLLVDLIILSFCLVETWISYKVLLCELSFYYFFVEFY